MKRFISVAVAALLFCTTGIAQTVTITQDGKPVPLPAGSVVQITITSPPIAPPVPTPGPAPSAWTTLPQAYLDTTYAPPVGSVITVNAGANLQAAIDAAKLGDTLVLQAGATFNGPIILTPKTGTGWIYIQSSGTLPKPGNRVTPANVSAMATIVGTGSPVIALQTQGAAHHYRFVGIEFKPAPLAYATSLIRLGDSETSVVASPSNIVFDRCYIHGDPTLGGRRGIAMNSAASAVVDSYLSDWKENGGDSQAIAAWSTPGPIKLVNNYIEAAGENVMFGGADPTIVGLVPADIEVRGNYFAKPLAWRGSGWTVKNLFEVKNARRVLVEGNVLENMWQAAQDFAVNIKSANQDGRAPQSVAEDITFRLNVIRHASNGIKLCGATCDGLPTGAGKRYLIQNNLLEDISAAKWGGAGNFLQTLNNVPELVVDRNTVIHDGSTFTGGDGGSSTGFRFTGNIVQRGPNGFKGSGAADGIGTLSAFFPGYVFTGNAIVGGFAASYPPGNTFPASYAVAAVVGVGADMALLNAATKCSVTGQCAP